MSSSRLKFKDRPSCSIVMKRESWWFAVEANRSTDGTPHLWTKLWNIEGWRHHSPFTDFILERESARIFCLPGI